MENNMFSRFVMILWWLHGIVIGKTHHAVDGRNGAPAGRLVDGLSHLSYLYGFMRQTRVKFGCSNATPTCYLMIRGYTLPKTLSTYSNMIGMALLSAFARIYP
jgi:hypothetical protein